MNQYIKLVRKCKNNSRIELPDHTTILVSTESLNTEWELVKDSSTTQKVVCKEQVSTKKSKPSNNTFNSNGLGLSHPYEVVNLNRSSIPYDNETDVPF